MTDSNTAPQNFLDELSGSLLLTNVGTPFLIGLAVGYFAKKVIRLGLAVSGAVIALLFVLEHFGIISVNIGHLQALAGSAAETAKTSSEFLTANLKQYSSQGVSAVAGFFVGLKLG